MWTDRLTTEKINTDRWAYGQMRTLKDVCIYRKMDKCTDKQQTGRWADKHAVAWQWADKPTRSQTYGEKNFGAEFTTLHFHLNLLKGQISLITQG
jgi:hypothetical protein